MIDRLPTLAREILNDLQETRDRARSPFHDENGSVSNTLAGQLRIVAVAAFKLKGSIVAFRGFLHESSSLRLTLLQRFDEGQPINEAFVSLAAYKGLFDALASTDMELASRFAARLGGRPAQEKQDTKLTKCFAYALKYLVLDDEERAGKTLADFQQVCSMDRNKVFLGYAKTMDAILRREAIDVVDGLSVLVRTHSRLCGSGAIFHLMPDELISIWGLGLANVAAHRGLPVPIDDPFLPRVLIKPVE